MVSWREWAPWQEMYDGWVKAFGKENINLTWPYLRGLYDWLMRELEAHPEVDIETLDIPSFITHEIDIENAKKILTNLMRKPLSEREREGMYEKYKDYLQKQVREKYPEVIEELESKIVKLETEARRGRKRLKRIKELERKVAETERLLEEERAKPAEVAPVKIRILRPFSEGIMDYTVGSVVETRNVDWALDKIEKGFAERVPLEVPVEVVKPPPPVKPPEVKVPPPKVLPPIPEKCPVCGEPIMQMEKVPILIRDPLRLSAEEEYFRASIGLPIPTVHAEMIDVPATMKIWMCKNDHYFERDARGRLVQKTPEFLYRKILRETAKLRRITAPPPVMPPRVGVPPPPPVKLKPPMASPKRWLLETKGLTWGEFLKLSEEERNILLKEYERLVEKFRREKRI